MENYKIDSAAERSSPTVGSTYNTGRIQEGVQGILTPNKNVSDSELPNRGAQTPQAIDSFLNGKIFGAFRIEGNLVQCSNTECREALWQGLIDFFNNPEVDLVGYLLHTAIHTQDAECKDRALIALSELKTCADNMPPEDAFEVLSIIEDYVQDWAKMAPSSTEQERAAIEAILGQIQALGIVQGIGCDPNAIALKFLEKNSEAFNFGNKGALRQSLENSLQDPVEAAKLIKGLLNIATDNTEPPPPGKQMAAICLGELPGNQDLLSKLSSIFVSWAGESPDEDIQVLFNGLSQLDSFKVLKNPNQSSPEDLEGARGALRERLQSLFNAPGKNLIQALIALAFAADENIGPEICENALIALKEISIWKPDLKPAIEALLSAGTKNALGIYEHPMDESAQQSVFFFLERILRLNVMNPEQNLNIFPQQDDNALTIFNQDIDNRIIDTAFKKLADPGTNEEALDLLYAMFDIYATRAAETNSTTPAFPAFFTFNNRLLEVFEKGPEKAEQAIELLMRLVNIFPPNIIKYIEEPYDNTINFLIDNTPSDENALNLLEEIILSELHVFRGNFKETKSSIEKNFETLRNSSSNTEGAEEAWGRIQQEIERIKNHIAGQSGETIQNYQERLQNVYKTGQDSHMWHFWVQLNKRMQWPSAADLTNILKDEYQKFKDQGMLYTLVEIYKSTQDGSICENIRNFLIEQYDALDKEENVLATSVLELLQQMYTSNPQDEGLREFLAAKEALPAAGEFPTFSPLTTLVDDSEEEDQGESLGIGNRNSDSIVQQQIAETTDAQNLLDNENDLANIPSLKGQEQPKVNNYQEQPQGQQSFWGRIGKAAGAAWNGAVEATKNFMDRMDPHVQLHSQKDFIQTTLRRTTQECGGNGHCLVLSVLRQTDPQRFNDAYKQKDGRFVMAADYRMTLVDWAEQNATGTPKEQKTIKATINALRNIREDKDGELIGEYLDANSYVGQWIAQRERRPVIIFSENSRMEPGIGNYIDEHGIPQGSVDYTRRPIPANAILLYHSGNGKNGHYQAVV